MVDWSIRAYLLSFSGRALPHQEFHQEMPAGTVEASSGPPPEPGVHGIVRTYFKKVDESK
jgi:hypothetical protein